MSDAQDRPGDVHIKQPLSELRHHPYGYRQVWIGDEYIGTVWRLGSTDEAGWPWYFQCWQQTCVLCCSAHDGLITEADAVKALVDHVRAT